MPDWAVQFLGPIFGGLTAGAMLAGSVRSELRALREAMHETRKGVTRAHDRITEHVERHHVRAG